MSNVRLVLIGTPGSEFRFAAELARRSGADVAMVDDGGQAAEHLRSQGGDLVMIDVRLDVRGFIAQLRSERMAVPVIAYFAARERVTGWLNNLKVWLTANNAAVMATLLLVIGVVMIGKGIGGY